MENTIMIEETESLPTMYTALDYFLINKLTKVIPKSGTNNRKTFQCNIDKSLNCTFSMQSKGVLEFRRLFKHLVKEHLPLLVNSIIKFLFENQSITKNWSSINIINEYIEKNVLKVYESEKKNIEQNNNINITIQNNANHCLDISNIDLSKLNQTVLEQGIYQHLPLKTIYSKDHFLFIIGFLKLGFEIGRNTNISVENFTEICKGVKVSKKLLGKVGNDYFFSNIAPFKGAYASFQIDASLINDKEVLVFVLTAKSRLHDTFLFDIELNFNGNLEMYREIVKQKIEKARENQINIVGLTTDNLPTQIMALNQDSKDSLQNYFSNMNNIIHFRCCLHLLNLAYKDWIKTKGKFTKYEISIRNILKVLNKNIFSQKISRKIPKLCITRWNSAFRALECVFYLRKDILNLIKNANKKEIKLLFEIRNDIKYIFSIGFLKVYPLLFHFASLVDYMQNENISCVESIIVIEYFLNKIKKNIQKFKLSDDGNDLYKFIKKRLILNENIQLYNLASLFHPDGIVRYRRIMGNSNSDFNISEDYNDYFHCIKDKLSIEIAEQNRYISIDEYKKNEYKNALTELSRAFSTKQFQKKKNSNSKNNSNNKKNSNKKQSDIYNYFQIDSKSDEDFDENDELPNTINLISSNRDENQTEEEDLQDEIVKDENIIYNLNKQYKTACVIDNEKVYGEVFIPQFIVHNDKEFAVIAINSRSFEKSNIKSIQFPSDSKVVTIEKDAFINSLIEFISIPSSLIFLEEGWCRGTSRLTNVLISPNNPKYAYLNNTIIIAKSNDEDYDTVHFVRRDAMNIIIPSFIKRIATYAFSESLIKSIAIPKNVAAVGEGSFYNCRYLQKIEIPLDTKLKEFEKFTFIKTVIQTIDIPSTISKLNEFWCEETTKINVVKIDSIEETNSDKTIIEEEDILELNYSDDENEKKEEKNEEEELINDEISDDENSDDDEQNNDSFDNDKITLKKIKINYANEEINKLSKEKNNQENRNEQASENKNGQENQNEKTSEDKNSQKNQNDNNSDEKENCYYENRKLALEWSNIEDLIMRYACYLSLSEEEAIQVTHELHDLITLPFHVIKLKKPGAISKNSKYSNFWSTLRGFKYYDKSFSILAEIATRLYAISASEVDAERAFSKLKWRFTDRRNCVKQKTMMQELHIESEQMKKIKSESDFAVTMWQHPNHKE